MNLTYFRRKKLLLLLFFVMIFITSCTDSKSKTAALLEIENGTHFYSVGQNYIYDLDSVDEFPAVIRSSGNKPVETRYTGIELSKLFDSLDINTMGKNKITFNALDGYKVVMKLEEIYEPNNVYLVFKRDGEYLKAENQGGSGPLQIVIRHDPFSQRWCKHVSEIIIE